MPPPFFIIIIIIHINVLIIISIVIVFIIWCSIVLLLLQIVYYMYQILQKFDIHWHDGGPLIAMMYHLRRVSDLLCNWKSCLLCYMKDVVLHCSIFFKWNKLVRVRVREFFFHQTPLLSHCHIRGFFTWERPNFKNFKSHINGNDYIWSGTKHPGVVKFGS